MCERISLSMTHMLTLHCSAQPQAADRPVQNTASGIYSFILRIAAVAFKNTSNNNNNTTFGHPSRKFFSIQSS